MGQNSVKLKLVGRARFLQRKHRAHSLSFAAAATTAKQLWHARYRPPPWPRSSVRPPLLPKNQSRPPVPLTLLYHPNHPRLVLQLTPRKMIKLCPNQNIVVPITAL